jgi:hypothetical protein
MKQQWLVALLAVLGCTELHAQNIFLSFNEAGPDGDSPVRMLITDRYLRIEDSDAQDGFILFDRRQRTIYSVSHDARQTLVIESQSVKVAGPQSLNHRRDKGKDTPPAVGGKPVTHYRYFTNNEMCFEVYAAEGLLPEAVRALREYHEVLAGEQAAVQARMPVALQQACDLADHVYLPTRYLESGFPVRWVRANGVTRQLTGYKTGVPIESKLFEVPKDYKQFTTASRRDDVKP